MNRASVQRTPDVEAMLTTAPLACRCMMGKTCLQIRNTLLRFWSIWASQTSSLISTGPPCADPPTLLTSTSMRENRARQASTIFFTDAGGDVALLQGDVAADRLHPSDGFLGGLLVARSVRRRHPHPGPTHPAPVTMATRPCRRP